MEAIIKEKPSLKKNMQTGAVINTDKSAYLRARMNRKAHKDMMKKIKDLEKALERIDKLEESIKRIEQTLTVIGK